MKYFSFVSRSAGMTFAFLSAIHAIQTQSDVAFSIIVISQRHALADLRL
jgi:hypothetical protein